MPTRRRFLTGASVAAGVLAEPSSSKAGFLTDVTGLQVGHFTSSERRTGCTVILFDQPATAGVDVRGSAPGTRETDLLNPINTVQQVNGILLTGGSAFGLDAATGVMRFLEERGHGVEVGSAIVPIVPAAVLFDLNVGNGAIRPDARSGYQACQSASRTFATGNVGAGAGATVGKLFGAKDAMKGGLGSASIRITGTDVVVGAIVAVNAVGDVLDHRNGQIIAGCRDDTGKSFRNSMAQLIAGATVKAQLSAHTTIGLVATNATLTKTEAAKVASMSHDGLARSINPVHTAMDGDTIFAAATNRTRTAVDVSTIGSIAAEAMARAVRNAIFSARSIPGYPAACDLVQP